MRTDPAARKQAGISFLLIDMKSPGVTVRPIITLDGDHEVNDVLLENVKVPVENRVYEENKGWTCAKFLLAHERTGIARRALEGALDKLRKLAAAVGPPGRRLADDPFFRRKLTELEIDLTALEFTELRLLAAENAGKAPGVEVSMLKINGTEIQQRLNELTLEALGSHASLHVSRPRRMRRVRMRSPCRVPLASPTLLQHAQDVDLRRLERDPAQHHREGRARPLIALPESPRPDQQPRLPAHGFQFHR